MDFSMAAVDLATVHGQPPSRAVLRGSPQLRAEWKIMATEPTSSLAICCHTTVVFATGLLSRSWFFLPHVL